ncbi:MAG: magnesium transporter [Spirochaetia bacterium]|nr:magnesium transporter [Spirochaetia bacterium]
MTQIPDKETSEEYSFRRDDPDAGHQILDLLETNQHPEVDQLLEELYDADVAYILQHLDFDQMERLFLRLPAERRGLVLLELDDPIKQELLESLTPRQVAEIVQEQDSDDAADIMEDLPEETSGEVISLLPQEDRQEVTELLSYPENTAGALMMKEFATVLETSTVKQAIKSIRRATSEADDIHTVYVIDAAGKYKGHIGLDRLILSSPRTRIKKITQTEILPIPVTTDREEVAQIFTRYNFISAPVVDAHDVMVGRITADAILEVVEEEASEDILRMGGVSGDETLSSPVFSSAMKRNLWLSVNLMTAFLASSVVSLFGETIEKVVILASLMPIVAGMGGNAASQTMAVIIRNIALGELSPSGLPRALLREGVMGLMNGIIQGLATGIFVFLFTHKVVLAAVITTAMITNMLIAASAGTAIPLILKRFGIDPAIASSIFVTTFTDVCGFMSFLGLARLMLPWLLN